MINSFIEYMESYDSFFDLFNTYGFYAVSVLFIGLWLITKNVMALIVAMCETTTSLLCEILIDESGLVIATGQFIVYGVAITLCRNSKIIQCAYLFVLLTIGYDYFAWIYHEKINNELSASIVNLSYYMYFLFLPFVYGLIIKGLFASGGGHANRLCDTSNEYDDINSGLLASDNGGFKKLLKKSNKGVL